MISFLSGKIIHHDENTVCLLVGGVGYELHCSQNTLQNAIFQRDETQFYVFTNVKEDAIQLFGFASTVEKQVFLSLIKVNGVGPKMALQILSGARLEDICSWIEAGDVKALTSLPKVGKKTAEQIILTLKGKLVLETDTMSGAKTEIRSALTNLGFRLADVEKVISKLEEDIEVEEGVRIGLQALTNL